MSPENVWESAAPYPGETQRQYMHPASDNESRHREVPGCLALRTCSVLLVRLPSTREGAVWRSEL